MSTLAELQDAIAALATGDVDRSGTPPELPPPLEGLARQDVARYARGLRAKRWGEVARALPLSVRAVAGLEARYLAWLAAHPAPACDGVLPPGLAEALRALSDLAGALAADPGEAAWAGELYAFEVLRGCARADGARRQLRAGHAVHDIARELGAGLVPIDPPAAPHLYLFEEDRTRIRRLP
ncbi:MAG TPA: hypothetical protein VKZ18_20275 [Polyangia bacterium]|nr:hypothetical protein [Polyangia bacterium]